MRTPRAQTRRQCAACLLVTLIWVPETTVAFTCAPSQVGSETVRPFPFVAGGPPYGAAALIASTVFCTVAASVDPIRIWNGCVLSSDETNV